MPPGFGVVFNAVINNPNRLLGECAPVLGPHLLPEALALVGAGVQSLPTAMEKHGFLFILGLMALISWKLHNNHGRSSHSKAKANTA